MQKSLTKQSKLFNQNPFYFPLLWVSRGDKPLADVGSFKKEFKSEAIEELNRIIKSYEHEQIKVYCMKLSSMDKYYEYGFFKYDFAPLVLYHQMVAPLNGLYLYQALNGLLFGYSPQEIQRFLDRYEGLEVPLLPTEVHEGVYFYE